MKCYGTIFLAIWCYIWNSLAQQTSNYCSSDNQDCIIGILRIIHDDVATKSNHVCQGKTKKGRTTAYP